MNSTELHCLIDRSGSMAEYGKPMLLVNLLRYIRQFSDQHCINARYLSWGQQVAEILGSTEQDVELPEVGSTCNTADLLTWKADNPHASLLVLTDGYFELTNDQRQRLSLLDDIYFIAVGGDADQVKLNTLSGNSYSAEQLDQALHITLRPQVESDPPMSRVNLHNTASAIEPEDDDEW